MTSLILSALLALASSLAPEDTATSAAWAVRGTLAWADESLGPRYLAIPEGPGHRVTIVGAGGRVTLVSTDAGPALFLQRQGRVGDLAVELWEDVCGLPRSRGLCTVEVRYGDAVDGPVPTPPSTSTEETP